MTSILTKQLSAGLIGILMGTGICFLTKKPDSENTSSTETNPASLTLSSDNEKTSTAQDKSSTLAKQAPVKNTKQLVLDKRSIDYIPKLQQYIQSMKPDQLMNEVILLLTQNGHYGLNIDDELRLELLISRIGEICPQQGILMAKKMGEPREKILPMLFRSWAAKDPVNAAQYLSNMPKDTHGYKSNYYAEQIATEWGKQDIKGTLEWIKSIENKGYYTIEAMSSALRANNIDTLKKLQSDTTLLQDNPELASILSGTILGKEAALNWEGMKAQINQLSDPSVKNEAYSIAIREIMKTDMKLAQELYPLFSHNTKDDIGKLIIQDLLTQSPQEAVKWTDSLENPPHNAHYQIIKTWAKSDPEESHQYIMNLPAGNVKDDAIKSYTSFSPKDNYEKKLTLLSLRSDENKYLTDHIKRQVQDWKNKDAPAAQKWLEQSALKDAVKTEIKNSLFNK